MSWIEDPGVVAFEGFNISGLSVDEAWLSILSDISGPLWLYEVSSNCHECPFERKNKTPIVPDENQIYKIDTQFSSKYRLRTEGSLKWASFNESDSKVFCEVESFAGEFGVYELHASNNPNHTLGQKCVLRTKLEPVNILLPIALVFLICILLAVASVAWKKYGIQFCKVIGESLGLQRYQAISTSAESTSSGSSSLNQEEVSSPSPCSSRKKSVKKKRNPRNISGPALDRSSPNNGSGTSFDEITQLTEGESYSKSEGSLVQETNTIGKEKSLNARLRSLDVFRGICIVIMIFADDGGGKYYFFEHSTWNGLYFADLAFPWFLWIMGVCIPISIRSQRKRSESSFIIFRKIVIRSIKLIFLGLFMNTASSPKPVSVETLRLPGVLQRFGFCYMAASFLFVFLCNELEETSDVQIRENQPETTQRPISTSVFIDLKMAWIPWTIITCVLIAHFLITFLLHVPGCPTTWRPSHMDKQYPEHCIGGAAGYIDRIIFTENHIYQRSTAKRIYKTGPFDPEGSLGVLTSLVQVWFGVQTGIILQTFSMPSSRCNRLLLWGITTGLLGGVLCGVNNDGWIPVNKNLWSFSYVLITSSLAWTLLCILYFVIDVKGWWSGSPFFEPGMNSILLYIGHNIARSMLPWNFALGKMNTHFSHLLESLWGIFLWIVLSVHLYQKKMFWIV